MRILPPPDSERQSNYELLRIIAMFLVLVVHADFFSLGKPTMEEITASPAKSYLRFLFESLSLVSVNVFVIISGYFGIRTRLKGVMNFLFMLLFWRVSVFIAAFVKLWVTEGSFPSEIGVSWSYFIPMEGDWFSREYFLLFFFAPLMNAFIEKSDTATLRKFTILYIAFQWVLSVGYQLYDFQNGYSLLSFIGLYLAGATIRRGLPDKIERIRPGAWIALYVTLAAVSSGLMEAVMGIRGEEARFSWLVDRNFAAYNGFWVVTTSITLFMAFKRVRIQNKAINRVAQSAFAVYLFHMNPMIRGKFVEVCKAVYSDYSGIQYIGVILLWLIGVFAVAVAVDRIRILIWRQFISDK